MSRPLDERQVMREARIEAEEKAHDCRHCGRQTDAVSYHGLCEECEEVYECPACCGPEWWREYISGSLGRGGVPAM